MITSRGSLTLALWQAPGNGADIEANLAALSDAAARAARLGAELLVTPEMYVTGYNVGDRLRAVVGEGLEARVAAIAAEHDIAVLAGLGLPRGGGITNSAVLIDAGGRPLLRYDKTQLFGELDRSLFVEGEVLGPLVELGGVRIGVLICYDVEFPESVRLLAQAGAQLVLVPTAQMAPFEFVPEHLIRVRAWENQVFVAYVNRVGDEGELHYVGRSSLAAPSGEVLASAGPSDEELLIVDVDAALSDAGHRLNPYLADRREGLRYAEQD